MEVLSKAKHSIAGHNVYFVDMIDWSHNEEYTTCFDRADLAMYNINCGTYAQASQILKKLEKQDCTGKVIKHKLGQDDDSVLLKN